MFAGSAHSAVVATLVFASAGFVSDEVEASPLDPVFCVIDDGCHPGDSELCFPEGNPIWCQRGGPGGGAVGPPAGNVVKCKDFVKGKVVGVWFAGPGVVRAELFCGGTKVHATAECYANAAGPVCESDWFALPPEDQVLSCRWSATAPTTGTCLSVAAKA